ncbi:hexosaminidase D isoform X1 [Halyomorpha halys]|uniref:hexosaminidase D isoform X1 n=2 Tax=Halyomorpha halys TaxID=286706 RepID=UPI0006D4CBAD|nr:hexosaminidase D-like [Halyomorpha halys]
MATTRKLWKTRKFAQLIFITTFSIMLILAIYSMKEKHQTKYVLKEKTEEYAEYRHGKNEKKSSTLNFDTSNYVKIIGINDDIDKVSFKDKAEDFSASAFRGLKIVHLDLKGAPPKSTYYADFFPFIRKLGASGVLIEYEDMFPYSSIDAAAHNAYTRDEIDSIMKLANESSLEVIPLIQTFGHLEFLLKLEKYKHLRENSKYPQAICPSKNETLQILFSLIDEILDAHKNIKYIHIGCDEVYQIGQCNDCKEKLYQNKWNNKHLMLNHITTLAKYINKKTGGNIKPLIWDDELRLIPLNELQQWEIGNLVEPVIWKYTADVENYLVDELWQKYSVIFKAVWFASAFKGARYPNSYTTYSNYYFENHKSWMNLLYKYSEKIFFRGGILTGWQRYDHFAVLCELLPVSIPSLALNLIYLSTDIKTLIELSVKTQRVCGCDANPVMATAPHGSCTFPGACLYIAVTRLPQIGFALQREKDRSHYKGWMSNYNMKFSFSNPSHIEFATNNFLSIYAELNDIERDIRQCMDNIYDNSTVEEWVFTYVSPIKEELRIAIDSRNKILSKDAWPKRPFF